MDRATPEDRNLQLNLSSLQEEDKEFGPRALKENGSKSNPWKEKEQNLRCIADQIGIHRREA